METRPANRPVWPFILGAVLLLLLIVLVARSCREDFGETPPPFTDTLDTGEMTDPPPMDEEGYGPADTTPYDRNGQVDTTDTADMLDTADRDINNPNPAAPAVMPGAATP